MDETSASPLTPEALPLDATVNESGNAEAENVIVTELSLEEMLRMEVIQSILKSTHDRKKRGQIIKEAAQKLGTTVRTVQRLVKNYKENGLTAIIATERADKGSYRLDEEWQQFILKTYTEGNAGSRKMSRAQVAIRVQARAEQLGFEKFPSRATVYRVLAPVIEQKEQQKKKRNIVDNYNQRPDARTKDQTRFQRWEAGLPDIPTLPKERELDMAKRFKKNSDTMKLVIVRDMWLTGFDAPCLHTLYVDKPMRGHGLMQAIARVNRVFKDKPGGLIVDYLGIADQLKEALKDYTESDRGQMPEEQKFDHLMMLMFWFFSMEKGQEPPIIKEIPII